MSNIRKQLKNLDVSKLRMKNGNTIEKELKRHASILADCLMEELDEVYSSYSPKVYQRSYDLYNSISIDDRVKISFGVNGTTLSMSVYFDEDVIHEGITGENVNVAVLMNDGWQVKKDVWFKDIYHFGYYEGSHFIEKGIQRYKSKVSNPFDIRLNINGVTRNM